MIECFDVFNYIHIFKYKKTQNLRSINLNVTFLSLIQRRYTTELCHEYTLYTPSTHVNPQALAHEIQTIFFYCSVFPLVDCASMSLFVEDSLDVPLEVTIFLLLYIEPIYVYILYDVRIRPIFSVTNKQTMLSYN